MRSKFTDKKTAALIGQVTVLEELVKKLMERAFIHHRVEAIENFLKSRERGARATL